MRPIETEYGGRLYRSRLEARWAVFWDAMWIRFDYEPDGYSLPSGWYLTDFLLLTVPSFTGRFGRGFWVEIKPEGQPTRRTLRLMSELARGSGLGGFVVAGNPWPGEFEIWSFNCAQPAGGHTLQVPEEWLLCTNEVPWGRWQQDRIEAAFHAARSARFEHGQKGGHGLTRAGDVLDTIRKGPRVGGAIRRGEAIESGQERIEGTEPA
jgi:hypothetical protein